MKTNYIYSILLVFSLISCKSSYMKIGDKNANYIPYYLKVYEADSLYYSGNYSEYRKQMKNLFKYFEPINISRYNEYEKYLKSLIILDKNKNYERELLILIVDFGYKQKSILNDSILAYVLKNNKYSVKHLTDLEDKYEYSLNKDLIQKLKKLEFDDEEIRERQGLTFEQREPLMKQVDKKNDSIIKNYIITNGFPSKKVIGDFSLGLLFNHFSYNGSYDFYKETLPSFIKNGTCNPSNYAALIDRWYLMNKSEPFYFMTWFDKIKTIENDSEKIKEINSRRKKIGLPSIRQEKIVFERELKLE